MNFNELPEIIQNLIKLRCEEQGSTFEESSWNPVVNMPGRSSGGFIFSDTPEYRMIDKFWYELCSFKTRENVITHFDEYFPVNKRWILLPDWVKDILGTEYKIQNKKDIDFNDFNIRTNLAWTNTSQGHEVWAKVCYFDFSLLKEWDMKRRRVDRALDKVSEKLCNASPEQDAAADGVEYSDAAILFMERKATIMDIEQF